MKFDEHEALDFLRDRGYAVVIYHENEIPGNDECRKEVFEDSLIGAANEYIDVLCEELDIDPREWFENQMKK